MVNYFPTAFTTFCAASAIESPVMMATPDSASVFLPAATLLPSSRTTSGSFKPRFLHRRDDAGGDDVAIHDAAENVHEDALHVRVAQNDLERRRDLFLARAAADVEEVRRAAAEMLDDVHRRHRQARAVDEAGDAAVELDVIEIEFATPRFPAALPRSSRASPGCPCGGRARCHPGKFWRRAP